MRLSPVSRHLLVFVSVLSLAKAQTIFPSITPATTQSTTSAITSTSAATTATTTIYAATTSAAAATTTTSGATTTTTSATTTTPGATTSTTSGATTSTTSGATNSTTSGAKNSTISGATTSTTSGATNSTTSGATTTTTSGATTTTTSGATTAKLLTDPCYKYTVLDDPWRSTTYAYTPQNLKCDYNVNWVGWYRLFLNGQSAQMSETCVSQFMCSTHAPLWLNGAHPNIGDGEVTRNVCGHWENNCCRFPSNPIKVKACPGGYYVYAFVQPNYCSGTYCAVTSINNAPESTLGAPTIFYPFGSAAGDTNNPVLEDGSSPVIQLSSSFLFFGRSYQNIYVNNNGYLTFNQASSEYVPYSFPANRSQDIIAGLWTDLDNRVKGVVSYQQYINGSLLTNATRDIKTYFPDLNFNASWVFVATWDKVAYFPVTNTNTSFQMVLISGRNISFILMNYGDIAVTEHPVQAGYDTISSTNYFVIPGSKLGSFISNLRSSSNVGVPGRWVFRVDSGKNNIVGLKAKLTSFSDLTDNGNIQMVLDQLKQVLVRNGVSNSIELKLRKVQKIKP